LYCLVYLPIIESLNPVSFANNNADSPDKFLFTNMSFSSLV